MIEQDVRRATSVTPARRVADSLPEELLHLWSRGELTQEHYHAMTAAWVSDNPTRYIPENFPKQSQSVVGYVVGRINGSVAYSENRAHELNEWLQRSVRVRLWNEADKTLIQWSIEKCEAVGLSDKVERLQSKLQQYERVEYPAAELRDAARVKNLDDFAKRRAAK